jgi:hypothetical protein
MEPGRPSRRRTSAATIGRMPEDRQRMRPQVLVGEMPQLVRDLVHRTLADVDAEIVPSEAGFRPASPGSPPPIVIVAEPKAGRGWERDYLRSQPDAVILGVERHGRTLAVSMLAPRRHDPVELTDDSLAAAVTASPTWEERFG